MMADVRAQLDSLGNRLDQAADVNQRGVARLGLQVGGRWLEELESQFEIPQGKWTPNMSPR